MWGNGTLLALAVSIVVGLHQNFYPVELVYAGSTSTGNVLKGVVETKVAAIPHLHMQLHLPGPHLPTPTPTTSPPIATV